MSAVSHTPVLLHESVSSLALVPNDIVVDGTFGGGGHSSVIAEQLAGTGMLICVDLDEAAEERFHEKFDGNKHVTFVHSNFKDVAHILSAAQVTTVTKVLLDLGTSVFQLLADTRGFSFQSDAPLAMTFSQQGSHTGFNAADIVNTWQEESIADIIYGYGEEKSARRIAKAIVEARVQSAITTSKQLADVIAQSVPRRGRIHPATKTFQALRIATNDELGTLTEAMNAWWEALSVHGRLSIITFHSLEDRLVKQWMKAQSNARPITKKPIAPSLQELQTNPRSRSAKLRTIEKYNYMIATLRNKIDSVPLNDVNKTLRLITRYTWIGTGVLFLCYSYFVGAITFTVISQRALQSTNKTLISSMGDQERVYLKNQEQLNENYASSIGLVKGTAVAFAVAKPAVAWNVGQ